MRQTTDIFKLIFYLYIIRLKVLIETKFRQYVDKHNARLYLDFILQKMIKMYKRCMV